jgi:hypothetical protein
MEGLKNGKHTDGRRNADAPGSATFSTTDGGCHSARNG